MTSAPQPDPPSFAADIRPLFRSVDVEEMRFVLDLTDHRQAREYAGLILDRVQDGSMPCDQPWDERRIDLFRRWMNTGARP